MIGRNTGQRSSVNTVKVLLSEKRYRVSFFPEFLSETTADRFTILLQSLADWPLLYTATTPSLTDKFVTHNSYNMYSTANIYMAHTTAICIPRLTSGTHNRNMYSMTNIWHSQQQSELHDKHLAHTTAICIPRLTSGTHNSYMYSMTNIWHSQQQSGLHDKHLAQTTAICIS